MTVLGSSGSYPCPGKACSGFLVEEGETRLLLDCGSGVLANLQVHATIQGLTAILISHMHPDHFLDLIPLRYALKYGGLRGPSPLPVYLPPGGLEIWQRMVAPLDETDGAFSAPFDLSEYQERRQYSFGALSVRFARLHHYIPSYGMEVRAMARFVYSGDAGPCHELVSLAHQADLFLCEATWLEDETPPGERGHLTAREAGQLAREAGVRRLLLTHLFPSTDISKALEAAKRAFSGDVSLAEEGKTYLVGPER